MIIDTILDRRAANRYTLRDMEYMYKEATLFQMTSLARALDSGNNKDIQKELCKYIDKGMYNPECKNYVNSVNWVA